MMTKLFSIFDPTTEISIIPFNWKSTILEILVIPMSLGLIPSLKNLAMNILFNKLHSEMKTIKKWSKK